MKIQGFILYKIFYDDIVVYVGRTKQPLQTRIRGHLSSKPMHRTIDIDHVSKIEYAEFSTEADMNLYEIYFINTIKPPLNIDDKCRDNLTVTLPDVEWKTFKTDLWEKWKNELSNKKSQAEKDWKRFDQITEDIRIIRNAYKMGSLTQEECYQERESLNQEREMLYKSLLGG